MTDSVNELMNDEAVYRTAPATPGLLNTWIDTDEIKSTSYIGWCLSCPKSGPLG